MRTARSLTVSPSMLCTGPGPGGAWSRGCVPGPGGGVCACSQGVVSPEFLAHTSENITWPQTLFAGGKNSLSLSVNES